MDKWINEPWYTHTHMTVEHYSAIKIWNLAICKNMDGPWGYYAKWNKSDIERQIPHDFRHVEYKTNKQKLNKRTNQTKTNA